MIHIGCHLSSSKGFLAMGKTATEIGADTFQFFTRNPRGGKAKDVDMEDIGKYIQYAENESFAAVVAHAPYTLNPCSAKENVREFARMVMSDDLQRLELIPGTLYNFHPGSHVGQGSEKGIEMIAGLLNEILTPEMQTTVLLETMAGKGSEIGGTFEELRQIIDRVKLKDKIGVCLDTCHVSDGGYDITGGLEQVLQEFDDVVGLERIKALHINDSLNPCGSHKDRHARIGEGTIGTEAIAAVVYHPAFKGLPCILETPNELDGYAEEIKLIREME